MSNGKIFSMQKPAETVNSKNPFMAKPPKEASETEGYVMTTVHYSHAPLKTQPDLMKGGKRNRKWGAVVSLGIIPGLDTMPAGPAVVPQMPSQFFDADELPALRARIIFELDKAIELAKLQVENPAQFEQYHKEYFSAVNEMTEETDV